MSRATTRRRALRRAAALTATPLLIAVLTACGGDDSSEAGDEPTTATTTETTESEEPEATADAEESEDAAADGEEVDKDEFLADFQAAVEEATTAHMTMATGASGMSIEAEGQVDYTTTPPSMALSMTNPTSPSDTIDMRIVDGQLYMNMGQMSQNKFYKIDLDDPNSPLGDMSELAGTMDPLQSFEQFAAGLETVVYVGEEEVEGEQLDHYVLTLDTTKIEALQESGAQGLPKELEYDLWLDDEFRMRQVKLNLGSAATIDMRIFDWDEPVDIEAPPASDVAPMPGG